MPDPGSPAMHPMDPRRRNLRDWGAACGADETTIAGLVAKLGRAAP